MSQKSIRLGEAFDIYPGLTSSRIRAKEGEEVIADYLELTPKQVNTFSDGRPLAEGELSLLPDIRKEKTKYLLQSGDVLFSLVPPFQVLYLENVDALISSSKVDGLIITGNVAVFRKKENGPLSPTYLLYLLMEGDLGLEKLIKGVKIELIPLSSLKEVEVSIPKEKENSFGDVYLSALKDCYSKKKKAEEEKNRILATLRKEKGVINSIQTKSRDIHRVPKVHDFELKEKRDGDPSDSKKKTITEADVLFHLINHAFRPYRKYVKDTNLLKEMIGILYLQILLLRRNGFSSVIPEALLQQSNHEFFTLQEYRNIPWTIEFTEWANSVYRRFEKELGVSGKSVSALLKDILYLPKLKSRKNAEKKGIRITDSLVLPKGREAEPWFALLRYLGKSKDSLSTYLSNPLFNHTMVKTAVAKEAGNKENISLFDPFCGVGDLLCSSGKALQEKYGTDINIQYYGIEIDPEKAHLSELVLLLCGVSCKNIHIFASDSLSFLKRQKEEKLIPPSFDYTITIPPIGTKNEKENHDFDEALFASAKRSKVMVMEVYQPTLDALKKEKKFFSSLDTVIYLPKGTYPGSKVRTELVLLRKEAKEQEDIRSIDLNSLIQRDNHNPAFFFEEWKDYLLEKGEKEPILAFAKKTESKEGKKQDKEAD